VTLIELLIALTIFAVVAGGVAVGMASSLGLTRNNRNRSVAANLAAKEMDVVRSTEFDSLPLENVEKDEVVDGVTYSILRETEWVSRDGTDGVCSPPTGTALAFLKVAITVSWPHMQGAKPAQSETILAPPVGSYNSDAGHLAVMVRDRNAATASGHVVTAVGPGGTYQQTTSSGCAFFLNLPPGEYTVSLNTVNYVDGQNAQNPTETVAIAAGTIASAEFDYDQKATLDLALAGLTGYGVPKDLGVRVANTGLALGNIPFDSASSCPAAPMTVNPSEDGMVDEDNSNDNYGGSTTAGTRSDNDDNRRTFFKFTLPSIPANCSLDTATLKLYVSQHSSSQRTLRAYQVNGSWSESHIDWDNQPGTTGSAVTTTSPPAPGWISFGVTSIVQSQYAGPNYGFMVRDSSEDGSGHWNAIVPREGTSKPELVLTWTDASPCPGVALGASADSKVRQDSSNSNYGNDDRMKVISRSSSKNERSFVKFDLPSVPYGCTLTGATLKLFQEDGDSGRTIQVYRAAASWTESGITWSNQPASTGSPSTAASSSSNDVWRTWDVLNLVQQMYAGSNHGFLVRDSSESSSSTKEQEYHTSEESNASTRPILELAYSEDPTLPSSQQAIATPLFPYLNGYQVWAGVCADADPEGLQADGTQYYPNAQRAPALTTNPNQTTAGSVALKSVDVQVKLADETVVQGVPVVAYHDPDSGCPQGKTHSLGITDITGTVRVALPYGSWRIEATNRTPVGSWPIPQLSPLTADPQVLTVTVN
jgi:type II secretory pathway pseudopilin PulG